MREAAPRKGCRLPHDLLGFRVEHSCELLTKSSHEGDLDLGA